MDSIENSVTISHWFGRLGNNVLQVGHALAYCWHHQCAFYCPPHPQFPSFFVKFGSGTAKGASRFFYKGSDFVLDDRFLITFMRPLLQQLLLPHLRVSLDAVPERTRALLEADTTVVAHVRGGDIFSEDNPPHASYIQNPLWWYRQLLAIHSDMILVAEDDRNPVVNALKSDPRVTVQSGDIGTDFAVLLAAKNLASGGISTFHVAAAFCSKALKTYFATNYHQGLLLPESLAEAGIGYRETQLPGYFVDGEWRNTEEQRRFMLEYAPPAALSGNTGAPA